MGGPQLYFPLEGHLESKGSQKGGFLLWIAAHDHILILDNLMLRGHSLANRCCMCQSSGEFVDNLLLQCHVANSLWVFMLQSLGIRWVLLGSVAELLFCWSYWLGKHNSNIWNLILGCLMWTIWTERNRHSFEDSKFVFFNVQCVHCSQLT